LSFVAYCVRLQLRPLPSTGITRLHRYYKPLRHPKRPGLSLASCQLIQPQSPLGLPVLPSVPFAYMPSPLPPAGWRKLFAHTLPPHRPSPSPRRVGSCILNFEACSAFTHVTACTLAESPLRPSSTGGFSSFVTSTAAPIATGRNEPVPGWDLHPLWTKRLSRRTRTISVTPFPGSFAWEAITLNWAQTHKRIRLRIDSDIEALILPCKRLNGCGG
jgi:hypothetical protein